MANEPIPYNPLDHSVVQFATNEKHEQYEATDFHEALLFAIAREIGRVHHNRYQTSWDRWSDDPHIPGIQWRHYIYDCDCPDTGDSFIPAHLENCLAAQPNFSFNGVCFRWYKNPGRGMSINKVMSEAEWADWFTRCLDKIREFDTKHGATENYLQPMPNATHFYLARCHIMWNTDWKDYTSLMQHEMTALSDVVTMADSEQMGADFACIVGQAEPALRQRLLLAIACGIVAEKQRAIMDDHPKAQFSQPPPPPTP